MSETIDLFERYDSLPSQIKQIIDKYSNDDGDAMDIESIKSFERELGEFGYVFEWGLDMRPFNLRKGEGCTTEQERKAREDWDSRYFDEEEFEDIEISEVGEKINCLIKDAYKINLVTCPQCGCINSHTLDAETMKCVKCGYEDELSSFPDLFY